MTDGARALAARAPVQVLRDQMLGQSLDTYADVLPKAIADENARMASAIQAAGLKRAE